MKKHALIFPILTALALTGLAGCNNESNNEAATTAPQTTTTETATLEPEESTDAFPQDITTEIKTVSGEQAIHVIKAAWTQAGRIEVKTDIVDPKTDSSAEGAKAIAICQAVKDNFEVEMVTILENDGTTFALAGHPVVGEHCTEY